jgi:hypothetical protein
MTPKEKAEEVFLIFSKQELHQISPFINRTIRKQIIKQCALIAVDEILKRTRSVDAMPPNCQKIDENTKEYWQQVKIEIQKL